MAHLSQAQIQARRERVRDEVLAAVMELPARPWYALQCKCGIDCLHMPFAEMPRIRLSFCLYPGEFDFFSRRTLFCLSMILDYGGIVILARPRWVVGHHG